MGKGSEKRKPGRACLERRDRDEGKRLARTSQPFQSGVLENETDVHRKNRCRGTDHREGRRVKPTQSGLYKAYV